MAKYDYIELTPLARNGEVCVKGAARIYLANIACTRYISSTQTVIELTSGNWYTVSNEDYEQLKLAFLNAKD